MPPSSKPQPARAMVAAASSGARLYEGACAVCHEVGGAPLFGSRPSLALNSNLHSAVPDNLIQVILHGIAAPASSDLGYMPAFKDSLTDGQVAELVVLSAAAIRPGQAGLDRCRTRPSAGSGSEYRAELPCRRRKPLVAGLPAG